MPTTTQTARRSLAGIAKPEIIRVARWNAHPWLIHGFSTRPHGHSTAYGGNHLNLGFTASDDRNAVERNRAAFLNALLGRRSRSDATLVTLRQVHSDIIHVIDRAPTRTLTGDGVITRTPGLLLAILTADCVPVLVFDRDTRQQVVAAFHAGWRGTLKRIVQKGVGTLRARFRSKTEDLEAAIGPCIQQCCYSVGEEVVEQFQSQFTYADSLFRDVYDKDPIKDKYPLLFMTARAPGHFNINSTPHLDLVEANRRQLLDAGVPEENIHIASDCTSCNPHRLWSHRAEHGHAGRMMSIIGVRK